MSRRARGFTIVELLVVIVIIGILAALLLPALSAARCRSKHSASQAQIQDISVALKSYETDYGRYPKEQADGYISQGGTTMMVDILSAKGPKNVPYYEFRSDTLAGGKWMSALRTPYRYRENASKTKPPSPSPGVMMNMHSFDIWCSGCGDDQLPVPCDAGTSLPPDASTCKNW